MKIGTQQNSDDTDSSSLAVEIASEAHSFVLNDPDGSTNHGHDYLERSSMNSEESSLEKLSYIQYMIDGHPILFFGMYSTQKRRNCVLLLILVECQLVEALTTYMALSDEEFDFRAGDWIAVWQTSYGEEWNGILLDEDRYDPKRTLFNSRLVCMNDRLPPIPDTFRGPVLARIGCPSLQHDHDASIAGRNIIGYGKIFFSR